MEDQYGREIDYVRISITDRCNLRCVYCMPEEGIRQIPHREVLTFDEIQRICRCMAELDIHKVKITGGEPLVRKNCPGLVRMIKDLPGIHQVTLTTNGILLKEQMDALAEAGIDGINISLDTLDPETFARITRRQSLNQVMEGLEAALRCPQIPLKINCVPLVKDEKNLVELAALARKYPVHVRFIEMMPIGLGENFDFLSEAEILEALERAYGPLKPAMEHYGNGPCHYYKAEHFRGKIGFISAMTHKFCHQCNRVRLTSEGYLKACLQYQMGADLKGLMRSGCDDQTLTHEIRQVIWNKPASHHFDGEKMGEDEQKAMSQIGG